MRSLMKHWVKCLTLALFLFAGTATAQVAVSATAESPVHFANTDDFSAGTLTITFNMPAGKTAAQVEVTLATGIEYIANSASITGGSVTLAPTATDTKPVFNITAASSAAVTLQIKRKVTKAAMTKLGKGESFSDAVKLTVTGSGTANGNSNDYKLPIPVFTVQVAPKHDNASGTSSQTFTILNGGEGKVKEIYFSIHYPSNVTSNRVVYNGTVLTQVGTVPTGLPNAGAPLYKATVPAGLGNQQTITITENYTVSKCDPNRQIKYVAYWGADKDHLFANATGAKAINTNMGDPNIVLDTSNQNTYFEWRDGLCGNTLGTFYATYENKGTTNGTAYNLKTILYEETYDSRNREYKFANFCIIDNNGNKIPIAMTGPDTNKAFGFDYRDLPALKLTALAGKNIGLTDEDGDGYADDMKVGAKLRICFDLLKNQGVKCLQAGKTPSYVNKFSVNPVSYFQYDDVCKGGGIRKTSAIQYVREYTFKRYYDGVSDGSRLPEQLVKDLPAGGYFYAAMGFTQWNARERLKGGATEFNDRRFKYHIELPAGVALKNVKFHSNDIFGAATNAEITPLPDIPAGTTWDYQTPNRPRGYITYDMVLENCNGSNATIKYTIYYLDRVATSTTFCEIPLVCESKTISTICPSPCSANGPVMSRTYVERADNSYGWTDHTMTARVARADVPAFDRQRALYLDDIEIFAEGKQASVNANNLYYYVAVNKKALLEPKSIKVTIGTTTTVLSAATAGVLTQANDASGNYFRWNLTSALPGGTLAAGQTFSVVVTYQVKSGNNTTDGGTTYQSGDDSFFYTLDNPNDPLISPKGYHTNAKYCGAKLIPTFYIADTKNIIATNDYNISGCEEVDLGARLIYSSRRVNSDGTYFSKEFRPARLIKKVVIKMPLAYSITKPVFYEFAKTSSERTNFNIPLSDFIITEEGNYRVYTYINKPQGQAGYLPPGIISVRNDYSEWFKPFVQASCKAREWSSFGNYDPNAIAAGEKIDVYIDYEDFYYYYRGKTEKEEVTDNMLNRPIRYKNKPKLTIVSGALALKATQREQYIDFELKAGLVEAPNAWVSVPNAVGIDVVKLEELNGAGGTVIATYMPEASLTAEKMFFLNKTINNAAKHFRLTYNVTNCSLSKLPFELHAGWNCSGNPIGGYQEACSDDKKDYEVTVAKTYKQITPAATNPGQGGNSNAIPMCVATPYSYVINSADEGNIYDVKLVLLSPMSK